MKIIISNNRKTRCFVYDFLSLTAEENGFHSAEINIIQWNITVNLEQITLRKEVFCILF